MINARNKYGHVTSIVVGIELFQGADTRTGKSNIKILKLKEKGVEGDTMS